MDAIKKNKSRQFLTNPQGEKVGVFLSIEEYNHLIEYIEELEDIKAYDEVIARKETTIPLREAIKTRKDNE